MTTRTILLINTEPNVREVVQACLSHLAGWQVFSTGSLREGLQYAVHRQPDAIILDSVTSRINLITFLQQLNTQALTQPIPVILMTTEAKWVNLKQLQPFQVVGIIDYSADPATLPQRIMRLLNWEEEPFTPEPDT